jgi:hypothetical protein
MPLYKASAALAFRGARVKKAADQIGADYTAGAVVAWTGEDLDTDGFHDNATNNSRLTIPAGVTTVRVTGGLRVNNITAATGPAIFLMKNGTILCDQVGHNSSTVWGGVIDSGPIACVATDYFELFFQNGTDTSVDIIASRSFFAIQVLA